MSAPQETTTWPPGCQLWPVDGECLPPGWTENPATWPPDQLRAMLLASDWLHTATGRAYGMCLEFLRPCRRRCSEQPATFAGGAPFQPVLVDGNVINIGCGCSGDCGCGPLCEIPLPAPVYAIASVMIDGQTVNPATYRVDNASRLVRLGSACWPDCQNLTLPHTDPGTFAVWYWRGREIPPLGRFAVTLLAIEFDKHCREDSSCVLPQDVTEVTINGMSYTRQVLPGRTGIKLVDDWVALVNPYGSTEPGISVWTPDLDYGRTQTWPQPQSSDLMPLPSPPIAYRYVQPTPQLVWTIAHNLGWYPGGIQVEGPGGETVHGVAIAHPDINTVRLTFNAPTSGVAYLS